MKIFFKFTRELNNKAEWKNKIFERLNSLGYTLTDEPFKDNALLVFEIIEVNGITDETVEYSINSENNKLAKKLEKQIDYYFKVTKKGTHDTKIYSIPDVTMLIGSNIEHDPEKFIKTIVEFVLSRN